MTYCRNHYTTVLLYHGNVNFSTLITEFEDAFADFNLKNHKLVLSGQRPGQDAKLPSADSDQSTGREMRFRYTIVHDGAEAPELKRARPARAITEKKASILRRLATNEKRGKPAEVANGTTSE